MDDVAPGQRVLAWGWILDGQRPDRFDLWGGLLCLLGVGVIMYSPRP